MLNEDVFDSERLPAGERFDAWREQMSSTHAPMRLESERAADFRAYQRLIGLGAVSMWPARFEQLVFLRTPRLIRQSDPEVYHLSLLRAGAATASWGRRETTYQAGDFHLNDSSRPYEIWTEKGSSISSIGVEIPKVLLPLPPRAVDRAVGRPLSDRIGPGGLLAQFLVRLAADTTLYRPSDAPRLGAVFRSAYGVSPSEHRTSGVDRLVDGGPEVVDEPRRVRDGQADLGEQDAG
ncbi:cupin domain-containing protein [Actinoplanes sp. CA-054009]